jgi:hypothetical protein
MVPRLSVVGSRGAQLAEVIGHAIAISKAYDDIDGEGHWLQRLGSFLSRHLWDGAKFISTHANAHVYKILSSFMVLDGYYLEPEPCFSCCMRIEDGLKRATQRLDALRAESKFTDRAIFCRLIAAQSITSISVKVGEPDRARLVKKINVYHSGRAVADAVELKTREHSWKLSGSLFLNQGQTAARVDLDIPIEAANIMFEFAEFYSKIPAQMVQRRRGSMSSGLLDVAEVLPLAASGSGASEGLQCPRCSRQVTDRYGICRSCGVS